MAKLFKQITAETAKQAETTSKQHTAELQKFTDALERLSGPVAKAVEVNPIPALFSEIPALPASALSLEVDADKELEVDIIKKHIFTTLAASPF